jgi:bifunctional UDP-N-acetylglucosamine pyrophosphorylase/glucosamine-1-phosphate N-acetyltransferase
VRDAAGNVQRIVEEKDATAERKAIREVNTGIMAIPSARLADWLGNLKNNNAPGRVLPDRHRRACCCRRPAGAHRAHPTANGKCWASTARSNWPNWNASINGTWPTPCWLPACVWLIRIVSTCVVKLSYGRDVSIDVGCVFEGKVELGDAVESWPLLRAEERQGRRRFANRRLLPFRRCGDRARWGAWPLRPPAPRYAELGPEVHIGNFVEVKNSKIAAQSKANHLAYIGDAEIGQRVNVGAGTITCNYDGANKHKTIIEDDVFIGSDTQLVAPVTVGRGATLGAGTTLTKNAPPDALTVSRARQITVPGWARPQKVKK